MEGKIQVNSGDVSIIAVNVDGQSRDNIPSKEENVYFESASCDQGAIGTWDRSNWEFRIQNLTKKKTKCTLNFVSKDALDEQNNIGKMESLLAKDQNQARPTLISDEYNNIRYIGANPQNWVTFNGETWRIIGLMNGIKTTSGKMERLLKIIREKLPEDLSWDSSPSNVNGGYGVNEWSQADIKTVLNGDYFKGQKGADKCYYGSSEAETECPDWSQVGLKKAAQDMIEEVVWNTGTASGTENTWQKGNLAVVQYMWERSDFTGKQCQKGTSYCSDDVQRTTTWEGKVGLMYPSDYGYATDGGGDQVKRNECLYTSLYGFDANSDCYENDWLYDSDYYQWTMTPAPYSSAVSYVFSVSSDGSVGASIAYDTPAVRPVVFLKSNVKINGGEGTSSSPYTLTLN